MKGKTSEGFGGLSASAVKKPHLIFTAETQSAQKIIFILRAQTHNGRVPKSPPVVQKRNLTNRI
jgi:hypothetical protein